MGRRTAGASHSRVPVRAASVLNDQDTGSFTPVRRFVEDYVRGLGMSAHNNALAYGYSVTATATFGVLADTAKPTSVGRTFLFLLGSSAAFAAVNALVTRGFRRRVKREPPVVLALATSLSALSISAGVGIAALVGWQVGGWVAWVLAPLLSTWAYLSIAALEVAGAKAFHLAVSDVDPKDR
jgi:hypothetical protein